MPYIYLALISVVVFGLVHLLAQKTRLLDVITHGRFLSVCGGVAISYVFVDMLPKLAENDIIIQKLLSGIFPYFERHIYVMALAGFLFFFSVNRSRTLLTETTSFYFSLASYAFFNFLVAYAVADQNNPEVKPLALFTFAIALHYFTNDYALAKAHGEAYGTKEKWLLILSLLAGWCVGVLFVLSEAAVALLSAFIGGGVILNVTRHELPDDNPHSLGAFLLSALLYTTILLLIGGHAHVV